MKLSDLIKKLEAYQKLHGDIPCAIEELHDYWGEIHKRLDGDDVRVDEAQLEGPKSFKSEKCVIFKAHCE